MRQAWILAVLALAGCSSSTGDVPPPDLALYVGMELDTWFNDPPAARVKVDLVPAASTGMSTELTNAAAPPQTLLKETSPPAIVQLPEQHYAETTIAHFDLTGLTADGTTVIRGATVPYQMNGIYAVRIPLFVGRTGGFSRPPSALEHLHVRPIVSPLYQYLVAVGGDPATGVDLAVPDIYDAAAWRTLARQPPFPRAPKSMVFVGPMLLLVDESGATWLDISTEAKKTVASTSLPFAEVAGGRGLAVTDGTRFIVGATRADGAATDKVFFIDGQAHDLVMDQPDPELIALGTPRIGAAAAIIGSSLVVVGGSDAGPMIEVLAAGMKTFTQLPFPPDATQGLGLAQIDATTGIIAGGKDPVTGAPAATRTFDLNCTADCMTTELPALPMALTRTGVFALTANQILVIGEGDDGENHAFWLDRSSAAPAFEARELRDPRLHATPSLLPMGYPGLVGGALKSNGSPALSIEAFIPP